MLEFIITRKLNHQIDPVLHIWQWQIPVYLFIGGLTAGLMILGAVSVLRDRARPTAPQKLLLFVVPILVVGMFSLFLDLEHKVNVWRFYTTFQVTSPMSWGSWILLCVVPASLLLLFGTMAENWPGLNAWLVKRKGLDVLGQFAGRRLKLIAAVTLVLGIGLGIYTGILLSAYGARPFWNTSVLGLLFLVSGLSSAAALVQWASNNETEEHFYSLLDIGLIAGELLLIGLMLIGMVSGPDRQQAAATLVFGGPLTVFFWVFVVMLGLLLPVLLEVSHLKGRPLPRFLAPVFVLAGGLIFRFFIVEAGQITTWISY